MEVRANVLRCVTELTTDAYLINIVSELDGTESYRHFY